MPARRSALLALPLALLPVSLAVGAPSADAATPRWHTQVTFEKGALQACKTSLDADTWKVRVRIDARKATETLHASADASKGGSWKATAAKGTVSKPGSFRAAKGKKTSVMFSFYGANAGTGAQVLVSDIGFC